MKPKQSHVDVWETVAQAEGMLNQGPAGEMYLLCSKDGMMASKV